MASPIRRLQSADRAAHAAAPTAPTAPVQSGMQPAVDEEDPLALLQALGGLDTAPTTARSAISPASPAVEAPPVAETPLADDAHEEPDSLEADRSEEPQVEHEPDTFDPTPEPTDVASAPTAVAPQRTTDQPPQRTEVLDILSAMAPVFRAAAIYPGAHGTPAQVEEAVRQMSRSSAQLADALARETDDLEIDLRWRRRRATVFTADLVASHWVSTAIQQGGMAFDGMAMSEAMPRLARGIQGALSAVRDQPIPMEAGWSPSAAVLALAPLIVDLQRYADMIEGRVRIALEINAAASAIGAAVGEEVRLGVTRLGPLLPEAMRPGLASELMAHVAPMALTAWEQVRGDVLALLQEAPDADAAVAILSAPQMTGGVPVAGIVDRLRTMARRLVSTTEYVAREMLGSKESA